MEVPIKLKLPLEIDEMKTKIKFAPLCMALASLLLVGCGNEADTRADASSSSNLLNDDGGSEAAVSVSMNEAMGSLSDTNISRSSTGLFLQGFAADASMNIERSCAVQDTKAVVTIKTDKTVSWERESARFSFKASSTVENDISRTWSKEGSSVVCNTNGKSAAIDLETNLTGYELDMTVDRTASRSLVRTQLKTGEKVSKELNTAAKGERNVQWLSQTSLADGSISREKSISFSIERSDSFVAKDGSVKDLKLSVSTLEDSPLQVTVVWDKLSRDRLLLSKLIESGTIKATNAGGGSIEASFSNLLMTFNATTCAVTSGKMEAKIYAEGASTASKIFELTAANGTITVQDVTDSANPTDVDNFDYTPCDLKDFNY